LSDADANQHGDQHSTSDTSVLGVKHRHAARCAKAGKPFAYWLSRIIAPRNGENRQYVRLIYPSTRAQQDDTPHQHGARNKQEMMMFTKSMITLGAAVVLSATLGSTAIAQTSTRDWWRAHQPNVENGQAAARKGCIRGEESASSAYPAWMHC
jgi:hypothetical protein